MQGVFPDPSTLLLRISFKAADLFESYSSCLAAGIPWAACANTLVYGCAPGDSATATRVYAVPDFFPVEAICDLHLAALLALSTAMTISSSPC